MANKTKQVDSSAYIKKLILDVSLLATLTIIFFYVLISSNRKDVVELFFIGISSFLLLVKIFLRRIKSYIYLTLFALGHLIVLYILFVVTVRQTLDTPNLLTILAAAIVLTYSATKYTVQYLVRKIVGF
ncbi:TPA: hypothetical protein HA246_04870 [Candidatus Woesearchaeota archaeon]|nr:hypothetical protein [Candidatus Woesearchaeota archaeon]